MKRTLLMVALASALLASMAAVATAEESTDSVATIRIEAYVDGRSQLILQGDTAQWHHFDYAAPGRWRFADEPTLLNEVAWYPNWPDVPDAENRDCDCVSDVFTGLSPEIPRVPFEVELRVLQSRFRTTVVEQPSAANDFTVVIEFNDNRPLGPAWYVAEFDVPSAAAQIAQLRADVAQLVDDGDLKWGRGKVLMARLRQADKKLSQEKVKQACKRLARFVAVVDRYEDKGTLTHVQAALLRDDANFARELICG